MIIIILRLKMIMEIKVGYMLLTCALLVSNVLMHTEYTDEIRYWII